MSVCVWVLFLVHSFNVNLARRGCLPIATLSFAPAISHLFKPRQPPIASLPYNGRGYVNSFISCPTSYLRFVCCFPLSYVCSHMHAHRPLFFSLRLQPLQVSSRHSLQPFLGSCSSMSALSSVPVALLMKLRRPNHRFSANLFALCHLERSVLLMFDWVGHPS